MLPFQRGFELIIRDLDEPVIPVNIDSIWGSVFSFEDGRILWKWPKSMLHPVTVSFGPPLPPSAKAHEVRLAVQELSAEAFAHRGREKQKLHLAFLDQAKRRPLKFCVADSSGLRLNYIQALGMVLLLSRRLFKDTAGDPGDGGHPLAVVLPGLIDQRGLSDGRQDPGQPEFYRLAGVSAGGD